MTTRTDESERLFPGDMAAQIVYDTLCDRGHDPAKVEAGLKELELWWSWFGPMIDEVAEAIGLDPYPDDSDSQETENGDSA